MRQWNDAELLSAYANQRSEAAFGVLVERYVALVYSAAQRQVQNLQLAEEVTQAVFIILAQKAKPLSERTVLSGWLCRTAHFVARNAVKAECRRQSREQEAHMQSLVNEPDANTWAQLAPMLDEAVAQLNDTDRDAVVLRFYEQKPLDEVGNVLGVNQDVAQKRVSRAVDKLRKFFVQRGVTLSAVAITGALTANSVQAAPIGLAITVTATAAKGAAIGGSTLTLIKGALKVMAWTKAKTAVVVGAGLLLAAGTTTITIKEIQERRTYPWQVPQASFDVLHKTPPQVRIVSSPFAKDGGWVGENDKVLGIAQPAERIVLAAFQSRRARAILPAELPQGLFDFIANLPQGSAAALQQEVKTKLGLMGKREVRETDVLLLKVKNPATQGLKHADAAEGQRNQQSRVAIRSGGGQMTWHDQPVSMLAVFLENQLKTPVVDQTSLHGRYDFGLAWDKSEPEALKLALLNQLGLELVPGREPIEMLVVEKAN